MFIMVLHAPIIYHFVVLILGSLSTLVCAAKLVLMQWEDGLAQCIRITLIVVICTSLKANTSNFGISRLSN